MSSRTLLILFLALAFGLSASLGVNMLLNARASAPPATVGVVSAAVAIPRGGMLTREQVKMIEFPRDLVPPGAITKIEDALDRGVFNPLVPNEPILDAKLAPKGAGRGMAALVPKGMRAFTIQTPNVATGVAGFILPGNRVDVLLTMTGDDKDASGGATTSTLLQNLEILAVDQTIDAPSSNKVDAYQLRSVTLQVTPEQSLKLQLAQNRGILQLSLRNPEDGQDARTRMATLAELRYRQDPPASPPTTPPPPPAVETPKETPPQKPIYVYHIAPKRITRHLNDGTSSREVISESSSTGAMPYQDPGDPYQNLGTPFQSPGIPVERFR